MKRSYAALGALGVLSFVFTFEYLAHAGGAPSSIPNFFIQAPLRADLLFVGDMMFDRTIRHDFDTSGPEAIMGTIWPLLASADFVAGNLEGTITAHSSKSSGTKPGEDHNTTFTFEPDVAAVLASYGFKLVSIGNNHIADFGMNGIASTKQYLQDARILYVGDPYDKQREPIIENVNGINVAFVAYDQFIEPNAAATRAAIGRAREAGADFIVVMAHWGIEYDSAPPAYVRNLASQFAEAGAHLIIGTHSHVAGESEDIGQTRVYYSLGNFIFDQYWDEQVRCGLIVRVSLAKASTTTTATYSTEHVYLERSGATTLGCSP